MTCWYDLVAFAIFLFTAILCALFTIKSGRVRNKSNTLMKVYRKTK